MDSDKVPSQGRVIYQSLPDYVFSVESGGLVRCAFLREVERRILGAVLSVWSNEIDHFSPLIHCSTASKQPDISNDFSHVLKVLKMKF